MAVSRENTGGFPKESTQTKRAATWWQVTWARTAAEYALGAKLLLNYIFQEKDKRIIVDRSVKSSAQ